MIYLAITYYIVLRRVANQGCISAAKSLIAHGYSSASAVLDRFDTNKRLGHSRDILEG